MSVWRAPRGAVCVMVFDQYGEAVSSFDSDEVPRERIEWLVEHSGEEYDLVLVGFDQTGHPIGDSVGLEEALKAC